VVEQISFKEFMKRDPDYIRIYKECDNWMLYGSADIEVKVFGRTERQTAIFEVEKEGIKINVSYSRAYDDKKTYSDPTQLNFHSSDCETFKTLLAHNPSDLYVDYWANNTSENSRRQGVICETIRVKGSSFNKAGKLVKTHSVGFTTPSYFGSIASRY